MRADHGPGVLFRPRRSSTFLKAATSVVSRQDAANFYQSRIIILTMGLLLKTATSVVSRQEAIDSLLEEFASELAHIDLLSPEINEADFDPEEDIRLVEQLRDIDYVEASPPDSELVSLKEVKDFDLEDGETDTNILLKIKDDILREKLLNINLLIAKIESLNDNPTPSTNFMLKSPSSFPIPVEDSDFFLEKSYTFSLYLRLETFRFDIKRR
ncbi:hypothetical protein Tco_0536156 [Tanacetum coccineum]